MPAIDCSRQTLAEAAKCFKNYSPAEKQAILIALMANVTATAGGTDYYSALVLGNTSTLLTAAANLSQGVPQVQREDMLLALWLNLTNGAVAESSLPTLAACLSNAESDQLDQAQLLLECAFNSGVFGLINP